MSSLLGIIKSRPREDCLDFHSIVLYVHYPTSTLYNQVDAKFGSDKLRFRDLHISNGF